eukprot:RCo051145
MANSEASLVTEGTTATEVGRHSERCLELFLPECHEALTAWYNDEASKAERVCFRSVVRGIREAGSSGDTPAAPLEGKYKTWADTLLRPSLRPCLARWLAHLASSSQRRQLDHLVSAQL